MSPPIPLDIFGSIQYSLITMNVPRYKAQKPMQMVFVTNADKCGDHIFTQIARKGKVAVYSRVAVEDGRHHGFETIIINPVPVGTVYGKGVAPTTVETESYPGAASFGRIAWHFYNKAAALAKMEELVKEEVKPDMVGKWIVPAMEFTFVEFAKENNLPIDKNTAVILQNLLREKSLKLVRTEVRDGKSAQIFGKA